MAEINDIPWKDYNDYAKNVEAQQKGKLKYSAEDRQVAEPAKVEVTEPSLLSAASVLLQENLCNTMWSDMPVLDERISKRNSCFSSNLIPRLGSQEKLQALQDKLDKLGEVL